MNPIDILFAKISRAEEKIEEFKKTKAHFLSNGNAYEILHTFRSDGLKYDYTFKLTSSIPANLSLIAGEAIQHLRGTLDHLVVALVEKNGNALTKKHAYPICTSSENFKNLVKIGKIAGVSARAANIIEKHQPYMYPPVQDNLLCILQDFNNQDKHHRPLAVSVQAKRDTKVKIGTDEQLAAQLGVTPKVTIETIEDLSPLSVSRIGEAKRLMTFGLAEPSPTFKAQTELSIDVSFEKYGRHILVPVTIALPELAKCTRLLVEEFRGELT